MPELPEIVAAHGGAGYVVAPAGYGKTHLIADAVSLATRRQLVLTHTYAGVNSLRRKMRELRVSSGAYRIDTIASWALRLCLSYPGASGWAAPRPEREQWTTLYRASSALLDQGFIRRILKASYGGVYVDEYQDCSPAQHQLVLRLARDLPCRVLGDPLQAIFDFEDESPVDWDGEILNNFERLGQLNVPQRWLRARQPALGAWLQAARAALEEGRPLDLARLADGVTIRHAEDEDALRIVQGNVCRHFKCDGRHRVIAIHRGHQQYKARCHRLARSTGGRFSSIEEIEGRDLFSFITQLERARTNEMRLKKLVAFSTQCMTSIGDNLPAATSRGEYTQIRKNTKNPAVAAAANAYLSDPSSVGMTRLLNSLNALSDVRVFRADLFNRMNGVLKQHALHPDLTLWEAAERYHSEFRYRGRPVGRRRLIGTTLLVKGLEFDHAIVLDAASLGRKELYVALTRGARSLTIISTRATLNPGI